MKDIIFKNFSFSYPDKEIYKNFNAEFFGGKINVVLGARERRGGDLVSKQGGLAHGRGRMRVS